MLYALLMSLAILGFGAIVILVLAAMGYLDIIIEYGENEDINWSTEDDNDQG